MNNKTIKMEMKKQGEYYIAEVAVFIGGLFAIREIFQDKDGQKVWHDAGVYAWEAAK